jgi:hypothetical protein
MDGVRYRSYVVRIWLADPQERADTRVRVEWIAQGIEVEARGAPAADLAARLDRIIHPEYGTRDRRNGDQVDVSNGGMP